MIISDIGIQRINKGKPTSITWDELDTFNYRNQGNWIMLESLTKKTEILIKKKAADIYKRIYDNYLKYLETNKAIPEFRYTKEFARATKISIYCGLLAIPICVGAAINKISTVEKYRQNWPELSSEILIIEVLIISMCFLLGTCVLLIALSNKRKYFWFDSISVGTDGLLYTRSNERGTFGFEMITVIDDNLSNPWLTIGDKQIPITRLRNWPLFIELLKGKVPNAKEKLENYIKKERRELIFIGIRSFIYIILAIVIYKIFLVNKFIR